ncbi:Peroxisomal membrane protein 11-1 [Gracilariopsis chorda]|uniref:Peroxisomal membrane protein 11-1 n=1 Tax=Gracilariopsis chorda TaxID=448386 RepID=A0A2V3J4C2_9FLOR|nr:Peroxisomal membrane protein 11-1 [Gracilariopsis chorda]|eukprot:PXF49235.1 Peroxisomal membrane protein 11-1 [Gracilariopsis chorda]
MSTVAQSWSSPLCMETWHRALSNAEGRDKLLRLAQYSCKLLRGIEQNKPFTSSSSRTLLALESALSTSRQIGRLLKWTSIYAKRRSTSSPSAASSSQQTLNVLSDVALFGYYLCDNLTFLCKTGVIGGDVGRASRRAARFWMASILTGMIGTLFSLLQIRRQAILLRRTLSQSDDKQSSASRVCERNLRTYGALQRTRCVTLMKQVADVIISMSLSQEKPMHNAITGTCGVVSSTIACSQIWPTSPSTR